MKKLFYTSVFAAGICAAQAQPVLEQTNLPSFGTTAPLSFYAGSVNPGAAGANQVWDFSGLTMLPAGNVTVVDPATTPDAATYPAATMAYKIDFTLPTPHTEYNYYMETSGKWEMMASEIGGSDPNVYTANYRTELEFPLAFGDVVNDQFQSANMGSPGPLTRTYDAYGQIKTVHGTYDNAVRIAYSFDGGTTTNYQWIIPNPVVMVFTYSAEENNAIAIGASAVTGVNDNEAEQPAIFPTLVTHGFVVLTEAQTVRDVVIVDAVGRAVRTFINPHSGILNLESLAPGFYIARVTGSNKRVSAVKLSVQ